MAHVTVPNFQLSSTIDTIQGIWKLTRAMIAAGWKYKASGDTYLKESAGLTSADRWAIGGAVNTIQVGAQAGTTATIPAPNTTVGNAAAGTTTITGVSGFTSASVGRFLQLSGYGNNSNNGIFRITAQTGTTVSVFNPNAIAETGSVNQTWSERYGGASATIATAGTNGATPGRAKITGLTGIRIPSGNDRGSVGNRLHILNGAIANNNGSWMITRVISNTEVEIENPNATSTSETNNGSIQWVEVDPLSQVYPITVSNLTGPWINLQGPSTLKVPINTNAPNGTFYRGEIVTQSTTNAQGQVLGVVVDTSGGLGYLVIAPCVNGTGSGVRGWQTGNTITGALSAATVSQSGTASEFIREIVFWKGSTIDVGHTYVQCIDQSAESVSRFSTIAAGGTATAAIPPGGATSSFPAIGSWVMNGTAASNSAATGQGRFVGLTSTLNYGCAHLMVANNIGTSGNAEDGSWTAAFGASNNNATGYIAVGWLAVDNNEDGDVDPYVTAVPRGSTGYAGSRTAPALVSSTQTDHMYASNYAAAGTFFQGWRRRGMSSNDAWQEFGGAVLGANGSTSMQGLVPGSPERVACAPDPHAIPVREPFWVISTQATAKMRKGTLRWWYCCQGGISGSLYGNGLFVSLGTSSLLGPFLVGPWDGNTPASNG